jgi:tRNA wybutosine-synthesizing protein 3
MIKERDFIQNKEIALKKLESQKKKVLVDKEIIEILDIINSNDNYYTSSSCYGRLVLLELPKIGDKVNAKFLGKWHRKIEKKEFLDAFKKSSNGQIWFLAQSPIIHIFSKDLDSGDAFVKKAVSCGFKNSGFRSIKKNIVIEITSTERIDVPIGFDGFFYFNDDYIDFLLSLSNEMIERFSEKLDRLKEKLI